MDLLQGDRHPGVSVTTRQIRTETFDRQMICLWEKSLIHVVVEIKSQKNLESDLQIFLCCYIRPDFSLWETLSSIIYPSSDHLKAL